MLINVLWRNVKLDKWLRDANAEKWLSKSSLRRWHLSRGLKYVWEKYISRHRRQPVQRPWGRNELGVCYLWQGSQGGKGYTKLPNFSKSTEPLTGGNGSGGGGGMSSSLSSFSGKTWCQGQAVNLDLSQKTMGPRNQWSVGAESKWPKG